MQVAIANPHLQPCCSLVAWMLAVRLVPEWFEEFSGVS